MSKALYNSGMIVNPSNLQYVKGIDNSDSDKLVQLSSSPVTSGKSIYNEGMIVNPSDMKYVKGIDLSGNDCLSNFPSGKINITNTNEIDVTNYATAQVVDPDLIPSNIKSGVNILGVTGSYEGIVPSGTLNITAEGTYDVTNYAQVIVNFTPPQTQAIKLFYKFNQTSPEYWTESYTFDRSGWAAINIWNGGPNGGADGYLGSTHLPCSDNCTVLYLYKVTSGTILTASMNGYDGGGVQVIYLGPDNYVIKNSGDATLTSGKKLYEEGGYSVASYDFKMYYNNLLAYTCNNATVN